jgi:prefoldin beta subunit
MDEKKIQEMQMIEQTLQNVLLQKQAFQMELSETEAALEEIKKSGDEVFKIIGRLMIKTDKKKMQEELSEKKKILEVRMKSLEKQEKDSAEKLESLRGEFMASMEKEKKS